ncbi:hypothetical protein CAC42_4872 [Sphaceloma murrayae]|uniref:Uncharacterized protein n=1 Tax=Sphaceloma murrayae TaxID=2082308 RepID=A0A2K1QP80_9PEZI|nr:hypothetical protein CAC42_4872 [Sphaceloma murrayae]
MTMHDHGTLGREILPDEPRRPEPAASPRSSRYRWKDEYDEKDGYYRNNLTADHHHPSVSSTGGSSSRTTDSLDLEKQAIAAHTREREREDRHSSRSSQRHSQDRSSKLDRPLYRVGGGSDSSPHHQTIRHYDDDDDDIPRDSPLAPKAFKILMYFLCIAPLISFALSIWTAFITITLLFLHPIRLIFTRKRSFSDVTLSLLAPTLNLHLRCIFSFPTAGAELQLAQTLTVLLVSSVFSLGVSIWCMILGFYWIFATIIGDPDGLDGRSDGRELVLSTRQKWDDWLRLSVRPELRS